MIILSQKIEDEIRHHAERVYPHECCGLLIGRIEDEGRTRSVVETYPVANAFAEEERHHRMTIPPLEYARAERLHSRSGLGVVGNYHSHPDHPAKPSQYDLEHLAPWTTMSYIIVSVREGKASDMRSWELESDRSKFNSEAITKTEI